MRPSNTQNAEAYIQKLDTFNKKHPVALLDMKDRFFNSIRISGSSEYTKELCETFLTANSYLIELKEQEEKLKEIYHSILEEPTENKALELQIYKLLTLNNHYQAEVAQLIIKIENKFSEKHSKSLLEIQNDLREEISRSIGNLWKNYSTMGVTFIPHTHESLTREAEALKHLCEQSLQLLQVDPTSRFFNDGNLNLVTSGFFILYRNTVNLLESYIFDINHFISDINNAKLQEEIDRANNLIREHSGILSTLKQDMTTALREGKSTETIEASIANLFKIFDEQRTKLIRHPKLEHLDTLYTEDESHISNQRLDTAFNGLGQFCIALIAILSQPALSANRGRHNTDSEVLSNTSLYADNDTEEDDRTVHYSL